MGTLTQSLRDQHAELQPHLAQLLQVADATEAGRNPALVEQIGTALAFLREHLLDHAYVEEQALYPAVGRALEAPQATDTMRRDHVEIGRLADELTRLHDGLDDDTVTPDQARAMRRILYGLHAIVRLHLAKEEEVYLPLLDERLSSHQAEDLLDALKLASHAA